MIKELPQSTEDVLAFEVTEKVTLDEELAWIEKFDKILEKRDKISAEAHEAKEAWEWVQE